jgi:hypothetical protein
MLAALTGGAMAPLAHINRRTVPRSPISDAQAERVRALYRRDGMLYESSYLRASARSGSKIRKPAVMTSV